MIPPGAGRSKPRVVRPSSRIPTARAASTSPTSSTDGGSQARMWRPADAPTGRNAGSSRAIAARSASRRARYIGRIRRRWRSSSPRSRKSAKASWSIVGEPWSARPFASGDPVDHRRRRDQPAEPEPGREGLARRADVHDAVRRQPLDRADRLPVVAVLRVVVVLDHETTGPGRPRDERRSPGGREHGARRVLVRRRHEDGVGPCALEPVDLQPFVIDLERLDVEAGRGDHQPGLRLPRVLGRHGARAAVGEDLDHEAERLREPGGHDDVGRVGARAAHAIEVGGQGRPELRDAAALEVAQPVVRRLRERVADGAKPDRAGELADVGTARAEVEGERSRGDRGHVRGREATAGGDSGGTSRAAREIPLGDELLVGLDDDAARRAELFGEGSRRRQRRPGAEAAAPDGVAEAVLELAMERLGRRAVERQEELERRTGPRSWHRTGPYQRTGRVA